MGRAPNDRLAAVMREANLSHKALARAVRDVADDAGEYIGCDHTAVSRWLSGMQPRQATARFVAQALSNRLGRAVSMTDIGMSSRLDVAPDLGLSYEDSPEGAATVVAQLWQADLDDVRTLVGSAPNSGAWADASLSWLVRPGRDELGQRSTGQRVGLSDVEALRATGEAFWHLDNRFGGGHARRALVQFLRSDLVPMLGGSYTEDTGRLLHAASAEITLTLAWMTYDAGAHGLAQRYFIQALRMAQAADDVLMAASVLDAMSHQATFLRRSREAANLARAARSGTHGHATPTLTAHFLSMEARALSAAGDRPAAERTLGQAVALFERREGHEDPAWMSYFDDSEMVSEFGHCYRDLGRGSEAAKYANEYFRITGSSPRTDFFVAMVLADGLLLQGEVEQACRTVSAALSGSSCLKSARCIEYVREFRRKLARHENTASARELAAAAAEHPLWD